MNVRRLITRRFAPLAALALMLGPAAGLVQAAAGAVDIASKTDHTEITIGDRFHYTVEVKYPKGGRIDLPSVLGNLGAFEVKEYAAGDAKAEGDRLSQTWDFTLSTFTVGDYVIPPQIVEYRQGQDTAAQVYMTQPIAVKVKRTSPETVKDIADIAGPEEPAVRRPWWLVAAAVLLGAAAYLAWRMRRRAAPAAPEVTPEIPPYEEAVAALGQVQAAALVRQNRARELCFELSLILRRFISRRYKVDALESTSSEFIEMAAALPLPPAQKPLVPRFCAVTDPVKFASATLLESEANQLVDDMRRFFEAVR